MAAEMHIQIGAIADFFKNNPSTVPIMGRIAAAQSLNTAMMALLTATSARQGGGVFGDKREAVTFLVDAVIREVMRAFPAAWDDVGAYLMLVRGQSNCGDLIAQTEFMQIEGVTLQMMTHERLHLAIHILTALGRQNFMFQEGPQTFQHPYLPPLVQSTFDALLRECSIYRCGHDDNLLQQIIAEAQACHTHCIAFDGKVFGHPSNGKPLENNIVPYRIIHCLFSVFMLFIFGWGPIMGPCGPKLGP
jgi:hypothetical protein